jgi:PAS domain S-box-containing protein
MYIPGLTTDVVKRIRKGIEGERHVIVDANGKTKDGNKIACEVAVSMIDLMNPGDLVFTIRNVERRREMMQMYRTKANAFKLSQSALFGCDRDGNIRECNKAFLEMFGLDSVEEARKHSFTDFMAEEPLVANFKKALDEAESSVANIVAEGDGEKGEEIEISLSPNAYGRKIYGVVGSIMKV